MFVFCLAVLTPVLEGVSVGILVALVLLLIFLIIIKRRRQLKAQQSNKNDYTKLDVDSSPAADFLQESVGMLDESPFARTENTPVQPLPHMVTWAQPVVEPDTKPRSASCPVRRHAIDLGQLSEKNPQIHAETPATRERRKHRRYRRSKTDSCCHVCQVQFTVFYNYYHSKLIVQLGGAVNIPSTFGVTYASYMELELQPISEKTTTSVQMHTNNPVFEKTAEFPGVSYDELLNMSLRLNLHTMDRFSHSTLLGYVIAPLAELDINPKNPVSVWRPITPSDQQVG